MPRPNLLKIDDVMLKAGSWAALAWLLGSVIGVVIALDAAEGLARTGGFILAFASAPIGLWVAGFKLRQREKRAWALYRLVDDHVEIPASDLLHDSDFTAETISRAIRDLNNSGAAFLVWDRKADVIQDGRLMRCLRCEGLDQRAHRRYCFGEMSLLPRPTRCRAPDGREGPTDRRARHQPRNHERSKQSADRFLGRHLCRTHADLLALRHQLRLLEMAREPDHRLSRPTMSSIPASSLDIA